MIATLLVAATVGIAIVICFFDLFYRFMDGWNGR
jgi:hypothetical protein